MTYEERRFRLAWTLLERFGVSPSEDLLRRILRLLPSEEVFFNREGEYRRFADLEPSAQQVVLAALGFSSLNSKARIRLKRTGIDRLTVECGLMFGDRAIDVNDGETMFSTPAANHTAS